MARLSGKAGEMNVAGSPVAGIKSWALDQLMGVAETTGFDSSSVKTFLPTISEWSGSFEGYKDTGPLTIGTEVALELKESATASQKWTGQAVVTAVHVNTSVDGVVTYSYDFQGTGALSIATG